MNTPRNSQVHLRAGNYFDRSAELFDSLYSLEEANRFTRWMNRRFRRDIYERYLMTIEHIRSVQAVSVLDVGIGSARYAQGYLEAGVKRVVGVDISQSMLRLAREHVARFRGQENIFSFIQSDIDNFHTDERFDVIVAMGFFDYVEDTLRILKRLKDCCRHSIIASFPSRSFYRTPIRRLRYRLKRCPVYFFRLDQLKQFSRDAGFRDCQITKIKGAGMDYVGVFYP